MSDLNAGVMGDGQWAMVVKENLGRSNWRFWLGAPGLQELRKKIWQKVGVENGAKARREVNVQANNARLVFNGRYCD